MYIRARFTAVYAYMCNYSGMYVELVYMYVQLGLKSGDREMVVDGGGHFSPAGIDGAHTCL